MKNPNNQYPSARLIPSGKSLSNETPGGYAFTQSQGRLRSFVTGAAALLLLSIQPMDAQSVTEDEDVYELSPFEVSMKGDGVSYYATDTLAGARIRTDLKDLASSISVVTSAFLNDTGARNVQDLLVYTTNTEVGGVYGNYGGVGNTFINGISESFIKPNTNTRVRGLDSADNTWDFFRSDAPWDSYNVSRVDLQRGPNSILFGIGSPAGIINSSLATAELSGESGKIENRIGSFNSVRFSADYNTILIKDQLAVYVAALDDNTKYRQKPTYNRDRRIFGALRWEPKFLKDGNTSFRANFESGDVEANRPRVLPPEDRISPFFYTAENEINRRTWDPWYAWSQGVVVYSSSDVAEGEIENAWVGQNMGNGSLTANPVFVYSSGSEVAAASAYQAGPVGTYGLSADGSIDGSINGFPYGSNIGIIGYGSWARESGQPGADKGFYKDKSLTDTSIFNYFDYLIDGPNKKEWQNWQTWNMSLSQTFLNHRAGIELVVDQQKYDDGRYSNLGGGIPVLTVDIRSNLMRYPWTLPDVAVANPDAGRAVVAGNTRGGGGVSFTERFNFRATGYGELRADDFLKPSRLTGILGRHIFTGLYSKETYDQETRDFSLFALDTSYAEKVGYGLSGNGTGISLSDGVRTLDMVTYLSGNIQDRTSASGLNLRGITSVQAPTGYVNLDIFDSHWAANDVDPGADWYAAATDEDLTQSENPLNYVGWTPETFQILSAVDGDMDSLYTGVSRTRTTVESMGLTWQGYWLDDLVVSTFGWRRDKQQLRSGASSDKTSATGVAVKNPALGALDPETGESEGESISWGVVAHSPQFIRKNLPWGSNISLFYSSGRNTRVENRYGFDGEVLPNAQGKTEDLGIALSFMDDRLRVKATWYETEVADANISTVSGQATTLGSNTHMLYLLEAWGTASALTNLAGMNGEASGSEWYWNWALIDNGWDSIYNDPKSEAFLNSPSTAANIAATWSWLGQMQPQEWYDAYGMAVDVELAAKGDYHNAINNGNWAPVTIGGIQAAGGGRINGVWPIGTVDNTSKGFELEVSGQITDGFNLSVNVSKTDASQTALGKSLQEFIVKQYEKYQSPAGDLRLWWGGDRPLRENYEESIWAAYKFQLETNGKMVAELAPWRVNMVANYAFQDGLLKGSNVGVAYRWEDRHILGYALNETRDNMDIDKPYWSDTYDHFDVWAGYERMITGKIKWRIQLNIRSLGEDVSLVPISVQPDGTPAQFRIQEGMTWSLTNTFSF